MPFQKNIHMLYKPKLQGYLFNYIWDEISLQGQTPAPARSQAGPRCGSSAEACTVTKNVFPQLGELMCSWISSKKYASQPNDAYSGNTHSYNSSIHMCNM